MKQRCLSPSARLQYLLPKSKYHPTQCSAHDPAGARGTPLVYFFLVFSAWRRNRERKEKVWAQERELETEGRRHLGVDVESRLIHCEFLSVFRSFSCLSISSPVYLYSPTNPNPRFRGPFQKFTCINLFPCLCSSVRLPLVIPFINTRSRPPVLAHRAIAMPLSQARHSTPPHSPWSPLSEGEDTRLLNRRTSVSHYLTNISLTPQYPPSTRNSK
jgi:hypothetical protein